jgi:hypothetical protein
MENRIKFEKAVNLNDTNFRMALKLISPKNYCSPPAGIYEKTASGELRKYLVFDSLKNAVFFTLRPLQSIAFGDLFCVFAWAADGSRTIFSRPRKVVRLRFPNGPKLFS